MATGGPAKRNDAYAAAHFALELDNNKQLGLFRSIEGGSVKADVMTYQNGPNYDRYRQLGRPKYDDLKLQVGMAMSAPFYTWISAFFDGTPERHDGKIIAADFAYKERARREFTGAIIKELGFPKLEGQDKNAAYMSVTLAVEGMTFVEGDGSSVSPPNGFDNQKLWKACNFRFTMDGFSNLTRVTKIDAFTVKQNVIEYAMGGVRAPIKLPSSIDFPTIAFYIPYADAQPLLEHSRKRVMAEKTSLPGRFNGSITTFDNSGADLFELKFINADIVSITPDKLDSGTEEIKQLKVEIYTESMEFNYKGSSLR
jgi:phage tail-like protein